MRRFLVEFWRDENAAAMVEYAILCAMIACVLILIVSTMGQRLSNVFQDVDMSMQTAGAGS